MIQGPSLVVKWLGLHAPNAGGTGSTPTPRTKTYMLHGKARKKNKNKKTLKTRSIILTILLQPLIMASFSAFHCPLVVYLHADNPGSKKSVSAASFPCT